MFGWLLGSTLLLCSSNRRYRGPQSKQVDDSHLNDVVVLTECSINYRPSSIDGPIKCAHGSHLLSPRQQTSRARSTTDRRDHECHDPWIEVAALLLFFSNPRSLSVMKLGSQKRQALKQMVQRPGSGSVSDL